MTNPIIPRKVTVVAAVLVAVLFFAASGRICQAADDGQAHVMLTDTVRASASSADPAWLSLYADSTQLPKTSYRPGEFSFWGVNGPYYLDPGLHPVEYDKVLQANIRGYRYNILWAAVQPDGPTAFSFNWSGMEDIINFCVRNGVSISALVDYTPAWANGHRNREFAPNKEVENEIVSLSAPNASLAHPYVIVAEPDVMPVVLTPLVPSVTQRDDELVCDNFSFWLQPRCQYWPVVVGTEQVWVDENDGNGWTLWQRVDNLKDSPNGAKHYMFDRSGRIKFRNDTYYYYHGKIPAAGSKVKISYQSLDSQYVRGIDYNLDHLTGQISRREGDLTDVLAADHFDNAALDAHWAWMNEPASWDVNTSVAGNLHVSPSAPADGIGHFLYQQVEGSGDFVAIARVQANASGGNTQTGVAVYQDAGNWFRYCISNDLGRPILTRCVGGVVTEYGRNGEIGFQVYPAKNVIVRKTGDTWTVFTSNSNLSEVDGGYQAEYSFTQAYTYPMKVGAVFIGTEGGFSDLDRFEIREPAIPNGVDVKAGYNYLDYQVFQNFLTHLVGHFKDRIKFWEIYNEPDQGWTYRGGIDIYAILLQKAAEAIHAADPEAKVMNGGFANGFNYHFDKIYDTIPKESFDIISWHPYSFSNQAPGPNNWAYSANNTLARNIMAENGDSEKRAFFGEVSTGSQILAVGGGMNDRKQADYAMRLFLWSRRLGYPQAVFWFPGIDLYPVTYGEDWVWGAHEGLFYANSNGPKPVYYTYKNAATNKGVLMDLVDYDDNSNPTPASKKYTIKSVSVGVQDASAVQSVKVLTSLTATDAVAYSPQIAARKWGPTYAEPLLVSASPVVNENEYWTITYIGSGQFQVTGSVSGPQGIASTGVPFDTINGSLHFTLPAISYQIGDYYDFETFKGDSFVEQAEWVNPGLSGQRDIVVDLPSPVDARYVSVHFVKAAGARSILVDEIKVIDNLDNNIASGKLYIVDGYQDWFNNPVQADKISHVETLADNQAVLLTNKSLYYAANGVGYIEELDRSSGIRLEGVVNAPVNSQVGLTGTMGTTAGGEKYIQTGSMWTMGSHYTKPFVALSFSVVEPLIEGLYVTVYGRVMAGSITSNSFRIYDGGVPGGVKVVTVGDPGVIEGEYVVVNGAAGFDGERVIYKR